ncbi:MAG: hypothetical protein GY903_31120, partial [Fuerstiella sp.]|nr:hypothetical protein [Fuerstiella sp.]
MFDAEASTVTEYVAKVESSLGFFAVNVPPLNAAFVDIMTVPATLCLPARVSTPVVIPVIA